VPLAERHTLFGSARRTYRRSRLGHSPRRKQVMMGKIHPALSWTILSAVLALPMTARAADRETREFTIRVDGKPAGTANITIDKRDDNTTVVYCDSNVTVKVLFKKYVYTCRSREVWKDKRLSEFTSRCNDDGKKFQVSATAKADGVHVDVNGRERTVKPEVWLTSYWSLPDPKLRDGVIPVVDVDNGRQMVVRLEHVGAAQITVGGQLMNVQHYRITGTARADLYYDDAERLVREEWVEDGHPTVLELNRIRR
jgi:hypothetical protein